MASLVKTGPVVLEEILNFVNAFSLFRNYLIFEKGVDLHLEIFESPLPKDALCQVWLKLAWWFLRRRWKCESLKTDRWTDDGQQAIRKAHLSFQLRWANKVKWPWKSTTDKTMKQITEWNELHRSGIGHLYLQVNYSIVIINDIITYHLSYFDRNESVTKLWNVRKVW